MERLKLVDVAVDAIIEMIRNKDYDDKGYLPSEGEMAEQLEVSRSTIREAVRSLEVRGFVARRHGKGVQVTDGSIDVMTRSFHDMFLKSEEIVEELLDIRLILEPICAKLSASYATKEDLTNLHDLICIMEDDDVSDEAYYTADLEFHKAIAKASGNRIHESIITAYTPILYQLVVAATATHCRLEQEFHYHRNVLDAIKNRDGDLAEVEMRNHLIATDHKPKETSKREIFI